MKKIIFSALILVFVGAFILFGRSLYMPIVHKIKGKQTTESVSESLSDNVLSRLKNDLEALNYHNEFPQKISIVAFKTEQELRVYSEDGDQAQLIKTYPFTAFSGKLGPKLQSGDKQIPEGIYKIEYLNPNSSYHLSMKVSYPNAFDKSKTKFQDINQMGGDIFIHGKSATIGCIPVGDKAIEELFLLAKNANTYEIPVIISPWDFRTKKDRPKIEAITWENELYDMIEKHLERYKE